MVQRFPFHEPESSRPGVELCQADFTAYGPGRVPFAGGVFTVAPGATSRPDTHDVSECWMLARGQGRITYDGQEFEVRTGDYLFFDPRKTHFVYNDGAEDLVVHTVWWLE